MAEMNDDDYQKRVGEHLWPGDFSTNDEHFFDGFKRNLKANQYTREAINFKAWKPIEH